jgi:hypothetical protein
MMERISMGGAGDCLRAEFDLCFRDDLVADVLRELEVG